jgi:2-oxoglutarate dehydrogenase E2 component (dihydrolipoamide succinyltransferase)
MSAVEIRVPAEQAEGTRSQVLRWLKAVGDRVAENEPLIELETDKVTVEVAAPGSGVLAEIVKHEQEEVAPGEILGRIQPVGTAAVDVGSAGVPHGAAARLETSAARAGSSATSADASLQPAEYAAYNAPTAAHATTAAHAATAHGTTQHGTTPHAAAAPDETSAAGHLSPAVRRLLAEHALDPSSIRGTGLAGRITVQDVMEVISERDLESPPTGRGAARADERVGDGRGMQSGANATPGATERLAREPPAGAKSHRVLHSAVRKRIAEHMVQSLLHTAPHVTTVFEANMTAVLAHRQRNKEDFGKRGAPLTLTAYFLRAAVEAIRAVPEANSRWTDTELEVFDSVHIGVATAVEEVRLVVPVLRDVESRELFDIARGLDDLVTRARQDRLSPADVRGGTFTISNHGVSGSLVATPIVINQPQSAILGVGKLEKRVVVLEEGGEDRIVVQPRCYVTLTIDHRVLDGHRANRFLQTFVRYLESWPE